MRKKNARPRQSEARVFKIRVQPNNRLGVHKTRRSHNNERENHERF